MAIVDLRGREHEPDVLALLDPEPAWTVIGWSRDDQLVACAGVQRVSDDEVAIRRVGAYDDPAACALLDAITGVATCSFLVAEVDEQQADLYRSCGFTSEKVGAKHVRCVRRLDEAAAQAESVRSTTLEELEAAIRAAWGRETSDDPDEWSEDNPARGQCAVTALLVRELLGGEILVANVLREGRRVERHAWNRLASGLTLDLTREQFRERRTLRRARRRRTGAHTAQPGAVRNASHPRAGAPPTGLGRFGFDPLVEPLLEVTAQLLSGRTQCVPRPARLEAEDAHLLVA